MDYLLHHLFIRTLKRLPEKHAVKDGSLSLSYQDLALRAGHIAKQLTDHAGIQPGDRVAFFLGHDVHQAIAILAITAAGGVIVPINAQLFPEQISHILSDSGAKVLLTTVERRDKLGEELKASNDLEYVWLMEDLEGADPLKRTCLAIETDLAAIMYTSGSTGRPKGVMFSHRNIVAGCEIVSEYLELGEDDRLLGLLPLSFDYGLNQLVTMLACGGTYRFMTFKFPVEIVRALADEKITGFAGIPPVWALLVRSSLAKTDLPHLRYISNSGGAVPTQVLGLLRKALPETEVVLMYGLTEAFRSTYLPPAELDERPTSMGKAIPNTEVLVLDDEGRECGPGEPGELVHRGPTVAMGYWRRPEETAERYREFTGAGGSSGYERVVYSGDLVKKDEEGFLYFIGRRDAMIKCSGFRISPSEVEEVVFRSGRVKEAAAIGMPNTAAGQVVKVFATPLDDWRGSQEDLEIAIIDHCSEHMPVYMVPRRVEIIDKIPKTAAGKVDYPTLRNRG